ncbi:MAG TPA: hypothetical protein VF765_37120 [Polyangiaceae bacterium]
MGKRIETTAKAVAGSCLALFFFVACSGDPTPPSGWGGGGGGEAGAGEDAGGGSGSSSGSVGGSGSGSASGGGSGGASGSGSGSSGGSSGGGSSGTDASASGSGSSGGSGGDDASMAYDAINSADVMWGQPCLYNFGSMCPFQNPQECGNHQAIDVTFPNGPQLLNATLFAGTDCSPNALQDNFNDQQNTRATALWMFTDDADVAGVSATNPTSAIWWVGPLTTDGFPPAGAPTTGCINYTTAMAMCQ